MPQNWKTYSVTELIEKGIIEKPLDGNHGGTHPKGDDFIESGIPFVMASDIENGVVDLKGCKFISKEQADTLRKGFSREKDVLLTHKASIGRTAIVPKIETDYIMLTPQVTYYRVKDWDQLDNVYLKYYFDSPMFQNEINMRAGSGSTRAYIGITDQQMLSVTLPPLPEQKSIAAILSALDDKIELNLQMNKTLEEMAMTLYKHWFVDFGPFQNGKFVESELGMIPEGWEVKEFKEFGDLTMGQSPKSEFYNQTGEGKPFHQGVKDYGERYPTDITYSTDGSRIAFENDILFSVRAPVGRLNIAKNEIILGRGLAGMRLKNHKNNFLFYALKNFFTKDDIIGDGTVYKSVNKQEIQQLKFLFPDDQTIEAFNEIVIGYDNLYLNNYHEINSLTQTRDTLLPKLISGEVRVKDAEKIINEVN